MFKINFGESTFVFLSIDNTLGINYLFHLLFDRLGNLSEKVSKSEKVGNQPPWIESGRRELANPPPHRLIHLRTSEERSFFYAVSHLWWGDG